MDKLIKNGIAIPSITPGTSAFRTQKILSLYNILQSDLFVIPTLFNTANSRLLILIFVVSVLITLVPGVILGIAIPFLINLSIRKAFPVLYHFPWAALFGGIFVLIGIVFSITRTEIHKLRDKSIIDEIRMDIV